MKDKNISGNLFDLKILNRLFIFCKPYMGVFYTLIEDFPKNFFPNRPWDKGDNPKTALKEFVKKSNRFKIDVDIERKLMITSNPSGFLKCVK